MEARHKTTEEVLADFEAAEEDVHNILACAAGTIESLADLPVCNEKKLNTLVDSYLGHVRRVQGTLKEHAHILDISDQGTGVVLDANSSAPMPASSASEKDKESERESEIAENMLLRNKKLESAARLAILSE